MSSILSTDSATSKSSENFRNAKNWTQERYVVREKSTFELCGHPIEHFFIEIAEPWPNASSLLLATNSMLKVAILHNFKLKNWMNNANFPRKLNKSYVYEDSAGHRTTEIKSG